MVKMSYVSILITLAYMLLVYPLTFIRETDATKEIECSDVKDSLKTRERLLRQENFRYIQMAQRDNVISSIQADSLRNITANASESGINNAIDILFKVREFIDVNYGKMMKAVNYPILNDHYRYASSMLPSRLEIPADYVSPDEREERNQILAMEQMAASIAADFEDEKLPAWQLWWRKHLRMFFGNMAWFKGKVTFINGQETAVPARPER